jgi:hypothetical protein
MAAEGKKNLAIFSLIFSPVVSSYLPTDVEL